MFKWVGFIALCISLQVLAQANSPYCDIYQKVSLGMDKIAAINAVGEPYNHTFEMKPEGKKTQYRFDLSKDDFVELYLTFDDTGKLNTKNIAGAYCAQ